MSFFSDVTTKIHRLGSQVKNSINKPEEGSWHSHTHESGRCCEGQHKNARNRYQSFAPIREGNQVRWHLDGCSYMWAVSVALEQARESIWILDWWLSPELYLRRPPKENEEYRLDVMLKAAAERGVKVKIIVYKEVTQALTLNSSHTKHHLEDLHENIAVFRHPDHLPDTKVFAANIAESFSKLRLNPASLAQMSSSNLANIYGTTGGTVLYWAHHEKLCIVDGETAFMGGLDLCYGRWDNHQHSIADSHPGDDRRNVFPGQDFNNARVMDFEQVNNWEQNKNDRAVNSRMGWADVSLSLKGPSVQDLRIHFSERWNLIMKGKYSKKNKSNRYEAIEVSHSMQGLVTESREVSPTRPAHEAEERRRQEEDPNYFPPPPTEAKRERKSRLGQVDHLAYGEDYSAHSPDAADMKRSRSPQVVRGGVKRITEQVEELDHKFGEKARGRHLPGAKHIAKAVHGDKLGGTICQLTRSSAEWSHGIEVEHSIANAYIDGIKNAKHFIYIENQFFITATCTDQKPVTNLIGAAFVERIERAHREDDKNFRIIVVIPAVPAFAGDLRSDDALATRAIMEFQYDSICRDQKKQKSIFEVLKEKGIDGAQYMEFYNLRSYDRIAKYATQDGRWDSVAECYMLNGTNLMDVPWEGSPEEEMDAFVSEELYVHSKLMIIDDKTVICGSANLNDRSQLGDHDSEIAIIINDPTPCPVPTTFAGQRNYGASRFASSLRRTIFRRHLGLLPVQDIRRPTAESMPIGHGPGPDEAYDWGSREDAAVADPFDGQFRDLWYMTARTNTEVFRQVFHCVPDDTVEDWKEYDEFYSKHFAALPRGSKDAEPPRYRTGHVVAEKFENDVVRVKQMLSRVRGTLVEMPLKFLQKEDIAQEGVGLNAVTEAIYT